MKRISFLLVARVVAVLAIAAFSFVPSAKATGDFWSDAEGCMGDHAADVRVCFVVRQLCTSSPEICNQMEMSCLTSVNNALHDCNQSAVDNVPTPSPDYCTAELQALAACRGQLFGMYDACIILGGDSGVCAQSYMEAITACNALDSGRCL